MKGRRMLYVIVLIIIINAIYITYAQNTTKNHYKIKESKAESLKKEYSLLSVEIDRKIDDMENLIKELESKQKVLDQIKRVRKYIDLDITSDLSQIQEIAANTPLDLETSAIVVAYSKKFNIKPSLILAVIKLESNFNKYEVGKHNDRGYMQIIPDTEKWLAKKYGHRLGLKYDPKRIFEPEYNIGLGVIYLSILKESYGENYDRILSEYNRGPYKLKSYYEKHKTYATNYSRGVLNREKKFLELND
ncbi:lytic transglycosylase domain-containing protein [Paramaledivibacter caminithermalis]|jgi:hypothetical protein|uniref:Transglycosylase SLT domain-containing protein n=1 Tax=Paramaledivibacter caminithermalis (strain DSM 15212 / CIP 107654 / DViRD3) TaxID=1121301 RepID=A0A1M6TDX8_PARC5|nr:transglycosylase SLT domain-containing protein [Paramaledivibacter caminithermalis]SHK55242.1 Transglycosylase SLT domain-containing protein [Paramaledivibacter caminithermalis DSM 15212]